RSSSARASNSSMGRGSARSGWDLATVGTPFRLTPWHSSPATGGLARSDGSRFRSSGTNPRPSASCSPFRLLFLLELGEVLGRLSSSLIGRVGRDRSLGSCLLCGLSRGLRRVRLSARFARLLLGFFGESRLLRRSLLRCDRGLIFDLRLHA